jgi:hypothetical protein
MMDTHAGQVARYEPALQFSDKLVLGVVVFALVQAELERLGILNRYLTLLPELAGIVMLAMIMLGAGRLGGPRLAPAYWVVFGVMCMHILLGAAFNEANVGSVVTSLRYYVRWLPVFLFPVFFGVSDAALRVQFKVIAVVALIQVPVALLQRFVLGWGMSTGDIVRGTVPNSASLSIFLACVIGIWMAAFIKGVQPLMKTVWVCILLMLPMTLNESKGALILMPAAVFLVSLTYGDLQDRIRRLLVAFLVTSFFVAIYIPIYDSYMGERKKGSIVDWVMAGKTVHYLAPSAMGNKKHFGRVDALIAPVVSHAQEGPATLAFGLGAGSVSESFLGNRFAGDHYLESGEFVYAQISRLLWELGFLGVLGLFVIMWLILRDALILKETEGIAGCLGLGWVGIVGVIFLSAFYSELMSKEAVSYPFWYFSGVVAARGYELRMRQRMLTYPPASPVSKAQDLSA